MTERRVVITGIGAVTPLGNDWATSWDALKNGQSGIKRIESMDPSDYACQIGGEVRGYDPVPYFKNPKEARRVDRYTALAMGASKMAMADSGLDPDKVDLTRVGVMMGSGIGGLATLETQHDNYRNKGPGRISPFTIPMMISNIASGLISMEYGFGGPNMSIVTACATANNSVGEAWRIIKFGDADAFICGGAEASFTPMGLGGFGNMKALSTRNEEPERASRPFDVGRDGFVMGEGAGAVIIEELEHAKKRGATILAELTGYGLSADAYHMSAPSPDGTGPARAMQMAMNHAKLNNEGLAYLNAHGTSTPQGDIAETKAIKLAFGDHAKNGLMVSSTKSMTGHILGGTGAIELAACIMAVKEGVVPPTINLEDQDPECDLDYVPNEARETEVKAAMSNGFGFGGHNASLLVQKFA
ncbi:MAG: beta-ketoacyl-ACP synthase II [Verrucomicrobiota bacterium JB023]|nr:beta-ketoacyl-ACP synthase II [Verrucomicrobiota bacterium JB023]